MSAFACDLTAISVDQRGRYRELTERVARAARDIRESADGFTSRIDESEIRLVEVAEWIAFERRCCPFLTFMLTVDEGCVLTVAGPAGAKEFIRAEFQYLQVEKAD